MRRENRNIYGDDGLDTKKILYITGTIFIITVIAFTIIFFVYGNDSNSQTQLGKVDTENITNNYANNTVEEASSSIGKTINEASEETNNIDDETTEKVAVNTSEIENSQNNIKQNTQTNNQTETQNTTKQEVKIPDPTFKSPVKGEILREFAKDKLVYSDTLGEWITHNGIDIKAEKTSIVKAAAEGTVKSIKNDPRYGITVIIEHVNGYKTIYSNLLTAEFVVAGEEVKQGQTVGTVGNTATFEIADEPHLHFELLKDDVQLDPELYIK